VFHFDDAGTSDGAPLRAGTAKYAPYANARFGFSVDVPTALRAMPEPMNGDGLQWRLGNMVAITASGMNAGGMRPSCAS
jgi:hypothetical protein